MTLYRLIKTTNPRMAEFEGKFCTVTGTHDNRTRIDIVNTEISITTSTLIEKCIIGDLAIGRTMNSTYSFKRIGEF